MKHLPNYERDYYGDEELICKCCCDVWDRWSSQLDRTSIRESGWCSYCRQMRERFSDCNCQDIINDI
jgi:hypothetical protein